MNKRKSHLFLLLMSLALFLDHLPSLLMPVWKLDEGYWWTLGAQVAHGGLPYRDATDNRSPLFIYLYAWAIELFGTHAFFFLHLGVTLGNIFILFLVYRIAKEFFDEKIALLTALFYLVLQGSFMSQETLAAHSENLALPPLIAGLFCYSFFIKKEKKTWLFWASFFLSVSFHIRQTMGIALVVFMVHLILRKKEESASLLKNCGSTRVFSQLLVLFLGFIPLPIFYGIYFYHLGILDDFLFWAYRFNQKYYITGIQDLGILKTLWNACWRTFVVMLAGMIPWTFALMSLRFWISSFREGSLWILFFILQLASTFVGWRFAHHYYIPLFPAVALLAGWTLFKYEQGRKPLLLASKKWVWIGLALPFFGFLGESVYHVYTQNPVYEKNDAYLMSGPLKEITSPQDSLFIWGYYPLLYYYTGLTNASRFVTNQHLIWLLRPDYEEKTRPPVADQMWRQLFEDFEKHPPQWILDTTPYSVGELWYRPIAGYPQLENYLMKNYDDAGVVLQAHLYKKK